VGDELNPDGTDRGWADRFAVALASSSSDLAYANLAIRGRKIAQVHDEQLGAALALKPDLVSVMAGANDLIRPGLDMDRILGLMDSMQTAFTESGATILTNTYPVAEGSGPFGRGVADRFRAYNRGLREIAAKHGTLILDLEPIPSAADPRLWSADRLHLNAEGHARLATGMLSLLGQAETPWKAPLSAFPPKGRLSRARVDIEWAVRYMLPWIGRRLTGRSSGDGRLPKFPELVPVAGAAGPENRSTGSASA